MGSPLGSILANGFLCHHEQVWLESCPLEFKLVVYGKHVGDTFLLFKFREHIKKFPEFLDF